MQIPYTTAEGKEKEASILTVDFSLQGLSREEIQVVSHLSRAAEAITPVFAQQNYDRSIELYSSLLDIERNTKDPEAREALENYNTIFAACNSPWMLAQDTAIKFPLKREQVPKDHPLREFTELLTHGVYAPPGRGFYPVGITEKELESLERLCENSSVISEGNSYRVVLHEERFRNELKPAIAEIDKARQKTSNKSLQDYLSAKIEELTTGSAESRKKSDHAWLNLDSSIDFLINTGAEAELDQLKGIASCAMALVGYQDNSYQNLSDSLMQLIPEFENKGPWSCKKSTDNNLPSLRFVNIVTQGGGYDMFPATVLAQTLPNDENFTEKYGSVDLIFTNVNETVGKGADKQFLLEEFIPAEAQNLDIDYMKLVMTTTHEIGHRRGSLEVDPQEALGVEDNVIDEAKAELFSMWSLPVLYKNDVITAEQEEAGYYSILLPTIKSLQMEPKSHEGARNLMFHYFMEQGAVVERDEGKAKYCVNKERMRHSVNELLGTIADIRSYGKIDEWEELKGQYIRDRKSEFEERLKGMPDGRMLIFPTIKDHNLVYPETYRGQPRTLNNFV